MEEVVEMNEGWNWSVFWDLWPRLAEGFVLEGMRNENCLSYLMHSLTLILLFNPRYPQNKASWGLGRELEELVPIFLFFYLLFYLPGQTPLAP